MIDVLCVCAVLCSETSASLCLLHVMRPDVTYDKMCHLSCGVCVCDTWHVEYASFAVRHVMAAIYLCHLRRWSNALVGDVIQLGKTEVVVVVGREA